VVSRRLPNALARVRSHFWFCWICGWQNGSRAGLHRVLRFPIPVLILGTATCSLITLSSTLYILNMYSAVKYQTYKAADIDWFPTRILIWYNLNISNNKKKYVDIMATSHATRHLHQINLKQTTLKYNRNIFQYINLLQTFRFAENDIFFCDMLVMLEYVMRNCNSCSSNISCRHKRRDNRL
jgi:hypothetical protein